MGANIWTKTSRFEFQVDASIFLGSGPGRLRALQQGLRALQLGLRPLQQGLRPLQLGLRPHQLGLRPLQLALEPLQTLLVVPNTPPANPLAGSQTSLAET